MMSTLDSQPWHQVCLGLGSNLDCPVSQLAQALVAIGQLEATELMQVSRFYRSQPLGPQAQPDYINAAVRVRTRQEPESLLQDLQQIEREMGRQRGERWGPRVIDIDILTIDELTLCLPTLTIPHPEIRNRRFVLVPLLEVSPRERLPDGSCISHCIDQLDDAPITAL